MLTPNPSTQISYSSPRQIAAASQSSGQVMYTVPAGKKFQGSIWSNSAGTTEYITPAGGSQIDISVPGVNTSYTAVSPLQITLVAGTIVTHGSSSYRSFLVGVETDA
jgi:hypothetical protein